MISRNVPYRSAGVNRELFADSGYDGPFTIAVDENLAGDPIVTCTGGRIFLGVTTIEIDDDELTIEDFTSVPAVIDYVAVIEVYAYSGVQYRLSLIRPVLLNQEPGEYEDGEGGTVARATWRKALGSVTIAQDPDTLLYYPSATDQWWHGGDLDIPRIGSF